MSVPYMSTLKKESELEVEKYSHKGAKEGVKIYING